MTDWIYTEELRAQLRRQGDPGRYPGRRHDRDVARMLSPWRRTRPAPGTERD